MKLGDLMLGKGHIFENLFVLEVANNHWGNLDRGKKIIQTYAHLARVNDLKVALKLQFRDVDSFIHKDFKGRKDIRYIAKTEATKLGETGYKELIDQIVKVGCIPMATAFDEKSVLLCTKFNLPIIKIASSDINDWPLIECVASQKKPVIISSGGASEKSLDEIVIFLENRNIEFAINHCVSLYPSENNELELNQIDYLQNRYPGHVIGLSSHEYRNWNASMFISYAKGARTWERHVDIEDDGIAVSNYCSLPDQVNEWFGAFKLAKEMSGNSSSNKRQISSKETNYLDLLVRGVYARRDIAKGYVFDSATFNQDFYLAVPLQKSQLSTREILNGEVLSSDILRDKPLNIENVQNLSKNVEIKNLIENRGIGDSTK
jgi:sialic acid synthase SpsE